MDENRSERVREMSQLLSACRHEVEVAEAACERWRASLEAFDKLAKYYESPLWREDYDAFDRGELADVEDCGALTEDGIFDLFVSQTELGKTFLRSALRALEA